MLLKKYLELSFFLLRKAKLKALIFPLCVYFVLPLITFFYYKKYGIGDELNDGVLMFSQTLIPIFSVLNFSFVICNHIEGNGKELFRLYCPSSVVLLLISFFGTAFTLLPFFVVCKIVIAYPLTEYLHMLFETGLMFILFFTVSELLTSVSGGVVFTTAYGVISYMFPKYFWSFYSRHMMTGETALKKYIPLLSAAVVLCVVLLLPKRIKRKYI